MARRSGQAEKTGLTSPQSQAADWTRHGLRGGFLGCDYTWTQVRRKQEERSRITAAAKESHQRKTCREMQLYRLQDHSFYIAFIIVCHREQKQRHAGGLAGTCPCAMRRSQGATQKRRRFSEFNLEGVPRTCLYNLLRMFGILLRCHQRSEVN